MATQKAERARTGGHPHFEVRSRLTPRTETLRFNPDDPTNEQYRDLQVVARVGRLPLRKYIDFARGIPPGVDYWDRYEERWQWFARELLVSWNVEIDGEPVPATEEGIFQLDDDTTDAIRNAWFYSLNNPEDADPLDAASNSA